MKLKSLLLVACVVGMVVLPALSALALTEDIVPFDWHNVAAKLVDGNWKVVDGDHWLLDFGSNQANANKAVAVIKRYHLDSHGFVGRPEAPMEYYLSGGKGPVGAMKGEDAIAFDPTKLEAKQINGSWKVVNGNMWMLDFGANGQNNANAAIEIIHKYGFTHQCFVGRPFKVGNGMMYWRGDGNRGVRPPVVGRAPVAPKEDCLPFDPANVAAKNVNGSWKVVNGNVWMLDFGTNQAGAEKAASTIQFYKMNAQCFVGRPNPGMTYYKVNGAAPTGAMDGEDAISFDPANVQAQQLNGSWKVVNGNDWMLDFGAGGQANAQKAVAIIQHYGFTQQCFFARGNANWMYFRK